jgi:NADH-quinone oxidoreductase chain I
MMTLQHFVNRVLLIDIIKGMALTLKTMFRHAVTRQYPTEVRDPIPSFRGRHAFVRDSKTGKEKCIMCMKCSQVCPSQCIHIEKGKNEEGKMCLAKFEIEAMRCIFCGYCVEVCPVCALVLTEEFHYSAYTREEILFTREKLLSNWDEFSKKWKSDTYFNKFWRPDGIETARMTKAKRELQPIQLRAAEPAPAPASEAAPSAPDAATQAPKPDPEEKEKV